MKARIVILVVAMMTMGTPAWGGDNGVAGLLIGAGSGALIGQAIGRNTEATLIGTAVGSFLGYAAGNEMDKDDQRPVMASRVYARPARVPVWVVEEEEPVCREMEMLAEVDGRPERVHGVACLKDGQWVLAAPDRDHDADFRRGRHFSRRHHHRRLYRQARWW